MAAASSSTLGVRRPPGPLSMPSPWPGCPSPHRPLPAPAARRRARPGPAPEAAPGNRPWLPASVLRTGATLSYTLASSPDPTWASSPADGPPSYGTGQLPAVGFSLPSGATSVTTGQTTSLSRSVRLRRVRNRPRSAGGWQRLRTGSRPLHRRERWRSPPSCGSPRPVTQSTDRDRHHRRDLLASGGDDRGRGRGAPAGRARRRGAALSCPVQDLLVRGGPIGHRMPSSRRDRR